MVIDFDRDKMKLGIVGAIIILIGAYFFFTGGRTRAVAGIGEPVQVEAEGQAVMDDVAGYKVTINYLYEYDIKALVVHTHNYYGLGVSDKLAPRDFALAWGKVAEYNDRIDFHWSQSGRWYRWHTKTYEEIIPVGGEDGVNHCSCNNHIIPANAAVKSEIKKVKKGDYIELKGYLVNVNANKPDGSTFYWNSSTTREDTGDGACEVIYVTGIKWLD